MSENGTQQRTNVVSQVFAVLNDHWELAALELGFESGQMARRFWALVMSVIFGFLAAIVAQVAIIYGLIAAGLSPALACLSLAVVYAGIAALIYGKWGRRDPRVGAPFAGTRREVSRSLQWMQKLFL